MALQGHGEGKKQYDEQGKEAGAVYWLPKVTGECPLHCVQISLICFIFLHRKDWK